MLTAVCQTIGLCLSVDIKRQYRLLCCDIECTWSTFDHRNATIASYRETTADRDVIVGQMSRQHLLYTTKLEIVPDSVERSEDDTLDAFEIHLQPQMTKQPINSMQGFLYLFYKEYDVLFGRKLKPSTCYCRIARQVTTYEYTFCMSAAIIVIPAYFILRYFS